MRWLRLVVFLVACGPPRDPTAEAGFYEGRLRAHFPEAARLSERQLTAVVAVARREKWPCACAGADDVFLLDETCLAKSCARARAVVRGMIAASEENLAPGLRDHMLGLFARPVAKVDIDHSGVPCSGPADAPVTVTLFNDLTCPACRRAVQELRATRPAAAFRVCHKTFPLESREPLASGVALGLYRASASGAFPAFLDTLLGDGGDLTAVLDDLGRHGSRALRCLDERDAPIPFETCASQHEALAVDAPERFVLRDRAEGARLGVWTVPTIFVNGRRIGGRSEARYFAIHVDEAAELLKEGAP